VPVRPSRPLTEALAGVAAAVSALALGAPWWLLVLAYAVVIGLAALVFARSDRRRPLAPRH
jgi:membrane protein implicated in regulation of membrane protease activity